MNERGRNEADISRYTDVEYSPEGYKTVYRWGDFLEIAGGHVYNAMDTIDLVSAGGEYEGFNPRYAYTCEFVGCSTLIDAVDPDPSYNGYLLNVFAGFDGHGFPAKSFELFGGVTLNDVPSFGFDDGWDGSCLNRLDWFEDAIGMDGNGLTAGLVTDDLDSIKSLVARCPAWIECLPSYSAKAAKGVDDVVQAVKTYRANAKRAFRESIPGRIPECLFEGARAAASKTAGGADIGTGPHI